MVFDNKAAAQSRVLDILKHPSFDEYRYMTRDELAEMAEDVGWNSRILGYGIVEIDAEDKDECYEVYI